MHVLADQKWRTVLSPSTHLTWWPPRGRRPAKAHVAPRAVPSHGLHHIFRHHRVDQPLGLPITLLVLAKGEALADEDVCGGSLCGCVRRRAQVRRSYLGLTEGLVQPRVHTRLLQDLVELCVAKALYVQVGLVHGLIGQESPAQRGQVGRTVAPFFMQCSSISSPCHDVCLRAGQTSAQGVTLLLVGRWESHHPGAQLLRVPPTPLESKWELRLSGLEGQPCQPQPASFGGAPNLSGRLCCQADHQWLCCHLWLASALAPWLWVLPLLEA